MSADGAGPAELWCRRCKELYPAENPFCPKHPGEELVPPPAGQRPAPAEAAAGDHRPRSVCWQCGIRSENATNPTCAHCHASLVPPALVIEFRDGSVVLPSPGESADMGRAGRFGHVFAQYPNVSRHHATVAVDDGGDAWLTPDPMAPNGTFVNDAEISERTQVSPGDEIRFAAADGPNIGPISRRIRQPNREAT
jgi:hypothetical protein